MIRKRTPKAITLIVCICSTLGLQNSPGDDHHHHDHDDAPPAPAERRTHVGFEEMAAILNAEKESRKPVPVKLPPLPEGVQDLDFREFYQMPVGPRGLEPSAKLLSLDGRRVRILGYAGEMERADKRQLVFAAVPLKPQPEEYGLCDDIPGVHVLVTVPGNPDEQARLAPGPLLLTGVLSVGTYAKGGETSFVRLLLDPPAEQTPSHH